MRFIAATSALLALTVAAAWLVAFGPGNDLDGIEAYRPVETSQSEPVVVIVEPGASTKQIADDLETKGAIESATQFRVLVAFLGYDQMLQSGEYELERRTPELDAVYRIRRGLVSTKTVTVVEGWRLEEIADAVEAQDSPQRIPRGGAPKRLRIQLPGGPAYRAAPGRLPLPGHIHNPEAGHSTGCRPADAPGVRR
jgi:cell division protein YceG involved in septum cleavage